jgi:hypothetical protein
MENYKDEVAPLLQEKTDTEISEEFIEEYDKLRRKYKRDFVLGEVRVVKVDYIQ